MDTGRTDSATELHKNHEVYFVPGLHRGLRVLEVVAAARRPMSISEIGCIASFR